MHNVTEKKNGVCYITGKKIDLNALELLYSAEFSESSDLDDFEVTGGDWRVEDGWLIGSINEDRGGLIYSNRSFDCDVIIDFEAMAIPPCDNDLNFTWHADGWNYEKNDASRGYIAGLGGWWLNRAGIEKYPDFKLYCSTGSYPLKSGKIYRITAGSIEGHCFIYADGELIVEVTDPEYKTLLPYGRVGFGTYASAIKFRNLKVYRAGFETVRFKYLG